MTVRDAPDRDPPTRRSSAREDGGSSDQRTVTLDGGFEPGRIYDVVYRARDPRVVGCRPCRHA